MKKDRFLRGCAAVLVSATLLMSLSGCRLFDALLKESGATQAQIDQINQEQQALKDALDQELSIAADGMKQALDQEWGEVKDEAKQAPKQILDGLVTLMYADLDDSFERVAAPYILPEYRSYVLEAIKYHIESPGELYRVARNLYKLNLSLSPSEGTGNLLFFFDGVSANLSGAQTTRSGFLREGQRYNASAVCIVVQTNENKAPFVAFAGPASTMPDNVRNVSLNDNKNVPTVRDGIYNVTTKNHFSYASLNVSSAEVVRCSWSGIGAIDGQRAGSIDIHKRSKWKMANVSVSSATGMQNITDATYNSTGCFNIGNDGTNTVYDQFMLAVTGKSDASTSSFSASQSGADVGLVIVDRSNYAQQMATIYEDDAGSGAETAKRITENSAVWHEDVLSRMDWTLPGRLTDVRL